VNISSIGVRGLDVGHNESTTVGLLTKNPTGVNSHTTQAVTACIR
jgi:hypothetical protein